VFPTPGTDDTVLYFFTRFSQPLGLMTRSFTFLRGVPNPWDWWHGPLLFYEVFPTPGTDDTVLYLFTRCCQPLGLMTRSFTCLRERLTVETVQLNLGFWVDDPLIRERNSFHLIPMIDNSVQFGEQFELWQLGVVIHYHCLFVLGELMSFVFLCLCGITEEINLVLLLRKAPQKPLNKEGVRVGLYNCVL
jgi:hypothetical protein